MAAVFDGPVRSRERVDGHSAPPEGAGGLLREPRVHIACSNILRLSVDRQEAKKQELELAREQNAISRCELEEGQSHRLPPDERTTCNDTK